MYRCATRIGPLETMFLFWSVSLSLVSLAFLSRTSSGVTWSSFHQHHPPSSFSILWWSNNLWKGRETLLLALYIYTTEEGTLCLNILITISIRLEGIICITRLSSLEAEKMRWWCRSRRPAMAWHQASVSLFFWASIQKRKQGKRETNYWTDGIQKDPLKLVYNNWVVFVWWCCSTQWHK